LDDYQQAAFKYADWSHVQQKAEVKIFNDHVSDESKLIERLQPFQVICIMRERTPLNRRILSHLTHLKLVVSTGKRNASLDIKACEDLGIEVKNTRVHESCASELTWALLMSMARKITIENQNIRSGGWQTTIGTDLHGKTIGIIGLGRIGSKIVPFAKAFGMRVIAWSTNLTAERAAQAEVTLVSKEDLFRQSDFVTVHLVLSERSRGIIGAKELALMKPEAYLINTSRGPLIEETALIDVLQRKAIAGAALDVFDIEPLPDGHPLRNMDNVLATPHIGYVTEETYRLFYGDTVKAIEEWLL
jgi:phosphoglycerate dehydrogenase-like enzyme